MALTQLTGKRSAVAIMAKAPLPGQVKTRLCPPLTADTAAALYESFLLDKIAQVGTLQGITPVLKIAQVGTLQGITPVLSYGTASAREAFEAMLPSPFLLIPQLGDDLGARLLSTFDQLFERGFSQVVAIDSDTPTLPTAYLEDALQLMAQTENDVVLGPTEDGGYYLIGLRQSQRSLFEQMPWSTAQVFPQTLRRAAQHGLTVACTAPWYDVDTPEDLRRLEHSLEQMRDGLARHTRQFFARSVP